MAHTLPQLPYALDALEPHISRSTLEFHHGKHHNAYVTNLNKAIEGTELDGKSLEDVITAVAGDASKAGVFNNAAQVWNHSFYWQCMKPGGGGLCLVFHQLVRNSVRLYRPSFSYQLV